MGLWGTTTADGDKPKFLPVDSNAAGSTGAREHLIAVKGGWGLTPGLAASGNDNAAAQPEVLVCVKNLAEAMGNASVIGIDWTDAAVGNVATFDITVTFDEAVDVTSAAWSNNQTVTNKAYILLSRLGVTDMVEDSTIACQYFSGSGTNQLVFRGRVTTNAAAGFIGFNGSGVGDDAFSTGIIFDGSSALDEEDGNSALGIRQEAGTAAAPSFGDALILDSTAAASVTVNGALTQSTTLVIDGLSGAALAVGQVVTVNGAGSSPAASITDADGNTGISTDNSLTITAVANVTTCTVSESITVADNIVLLTSTNGGEEVNAESIDLRIAGPEFATRTDVTGIARVGETLGGDILLEVGTEDSDDGEDAILLNSSAANTDEGSKLDLEDFTSGLALYSQAGSTSGTADVLTGITVAAAA
jgi:hypothetical protein